MTDAKRHVAYLVRWQEDGDQTHWRSTVENAYTGEQVHFSDRNELMQFLWHSLFEDAPSVEIGNEPQTDE